jgi:hypothetical protein
MAIEFPHLRRTWCSHYRTNVHETQDFPDLIAKWEDRARQRGYNSIGYEHRREVKGKIPKVDIITHGGGKTGKDADSQPKIQKASVKDDMYDPLKQKLFFKDALEIFIGASTLEIVENPPKFILQPNISQAPTSPHTPMNPINSRRHLDQSQNVNNLWFQLFSNILGN